MRQIVSFLFLSAALAFLNLPAHATDTLTWDAKQNKVEAQIEQSDLAKTLKRISAVTGWKVYLEPGTSESVSVKFKGLPEDEALRRILGKVNFYRDETNGLQRLFVFSTVSTAATQYVAPEKKSYRIPNELLVHMKRGAKTSIDQLAKQLHAKIMARDDKLGLYRLQFINDNAADASLVSLASNPDVAAAEGNNIVDPPAPVQLSAGGAPQALNLNPPDTKGHVVGLVDTAVSVAADLQKYMLAPINVVDGTAATSGQPSHGTAMFETLLQADASNPSMVQSVVVYGSGGEATTTYDIIEGISKAINAGANPVSVSSGGTDPSSMMQELIAEAASKGIVVVAAAGNNGGTGDTYPAAYSGAIGVTASGTDGKLASYADDGSFVKSMESGTSSFPWNGEEWTVQGTSPATATFSGQVADLANKTGMSPAQAAAKLLLIHPAPR